MLWMYRAKNRHAQSFMEITTENRPRANVRPSAKTNMR